MSVATLPAESTAASERVTRAQAVARKRVELAEIYPPLHQPVDDEVLI